ncbi:hypothetical protein C8R46DRAFT_668691 [Mycena filopes]|nr:hypothetical protein C8R46DRAFT_668691 [Mycena filopes]
MSQVKIPHDDLRITYSQMWTTTSGPIGSEHTTSISGESFTFPFNVSEGSTIEVHGSIRPTANASSVPTSSYFLDDANATLYTAPWATTSTPVLKFYNSSALPAGVHVLLVRTTSNNPYYFDFIQINDAAVDPPILNKSSPSATRSHRSTASARRSPPSSKNNKSNLPAAAIAGAVFGSVVLLLCLLWVFLLCRTRMKEQTPRMPMSPSPPRNNDLREPPILTPFDLTAPTSRSTRTVRIQVPSESSPLPHRERAPPFPRPKNRNRGTG